MKAATGRDSDPFIASHKSWSSMTSFLRRSGKEWVRMREG